MSTSFAVPAARSALLVRRRIATYFVGGIEGIPGLVDVLARDGSIVHDLSMDVRDGVTESSMVCAVLVPAHCSNAFACSPRSSRPNSSDSEAAG